MLCFTIDSCLVSIPLIEFLDVTIKRGLVDTCHDIKHSCINIIHKLANLRPQVVSSKLEDMAEPLQVMIATKTKAK
jgi:hypothetical protein